MDKRIKQMWVDALRSGEYHQGKGALTNIKEDREEDCCLGVLCKLAIKDGLDIAVYPRASGGNHTFYDGASATLPPSVAKWAGIDEFGTLPETVEVVPEEDDQGPVMNSRVSALTMVNDAKDGTFEKIATIIEQYL